MKKFDSVWVIDDDPVSNLICKEFLRRENFYHHLQDYIDPCEGWAEIERLVKEDRKKLPDVLFLDLNMPDMTGWEFIDRVETLPEIVQVRMKIVILTSSMNKHDLLKAKDNHLVKGFISKPISSGHLHNIWTHLQDNTRMVA